MVKTHIPDGFTVHDVSVENWRTYHYDGGKIFTVKNPETLFLKQDERGDSHRVVDKDGVTFYPMRGWLGISWKSDLEKVSF